MHPYRWLALLLMFSTLSHGQNSPCSAEQYRQFDFWLGEWQVTANQQLAGYNKISKAHNGCVLTEQYDTPGGYTGQSLNSFNAQTGLWHQTWMDNSGTVLLLDGGLKGKAMVMEGEGKDPQGNPVLHRITWTPNDDGSVRQHWQTKGSDGQWSTAFDGLYIKVKKKS